MDTWSSPSFLSGLHATFRVSFSWAAKSLGVKFPSDECDHLWDQVCGIFYRTLVHVDTWSVKNALLKAALQNTELRDSALTTDESDVLVSALVSPIALKGGLATLRSANAKIRKVCLIDGNCIAFPVNILGIIRAPSVRHRIAALNHDGGCFPRDITRVGAISHIAG